MKSHTGGLVKLNVLGNIKQNRGYATGGNGYEPLQKSMNITSNHFDTNNNLHMFDKYLMTNFTLKQKEEIRYNYQIWMEKNIRLPRYTYMLPMRDMFVPGNSLLTPDSYGKLFSKFFTP